jgi:hypothetical protein
MSAEHDPILPTPIIWSDFYPDREFPWSQRPTYALVRFAAHAEHLMATNPVRARSQGERLFRVGLNEIYLALNERLPVPMKPLC